jgi:hypothetical protein
MKLFEPDVYRANRRFLRKVKGRKLFTFFVSNITNLEPFEESKRPWKKLGKLNADGANIYVTTAIIDFVLPDGRICRIPMGFEWDGASIPKWAQGIIGKPMGKYALGALLHDWLYASRILGDTRGGRKQSDELFLMAMKQLDISWWRRKVMYRAVRFGGSDAYHKTDERAHCKSIFLEVNKFNPWKDYRGFFPYA